MIRLGKLFLQLAGLCALQVLLQAGEAGPASAADQGSQFTPEEDASFERGYKTFTQLCFTCHGPDAKGAPIPDDPDERRMAPPLSGSKRVVGRPEYVITALLYGVAGPVDEVNYEGLMIPMGSYGDAWIADIASFIRNEFGNSASMITSNQVTRIRTKIGERDEPFTIPDVLAMLPVALTNQAAWKVTASANSGTAANAIDGVSKKAAWTSGTPQAAGMWIQIELPDAVSVCEIILDAEAAATAAATGFPRGYKVQSSLDGDKWSDVVAEGKGKGPSTVIAFDPVRAKQLRISLTAPATEPVPWSVSRTRIFQTGQATPAASGIRPTSKFE